MTTVHIEFYKESGKWYTNAKFETNTPAYESKEIEVEIEKKGDVVSKMSYIYEAEDENGVNKRIVIK